MIENKYNVTEITIYPNAICFCPLGQDWYKVNFEAKFYGISHIPDYMDVDKYVKENINGKELIIEAATGLLCDYLHNNIHPVSVEVIATVNCESHSPVKVICKR